MVDLEMYTFEYLLNRVFSRIPNTYDKRQGSVLYDAVAPLCYELAQAYINLRDIENRTYADTSVETDLERRARERGITRNPATKAVRLGEFSKVVPIGTRFSIEDATYVVTENLADNKCYLQCEQTGSIGNNYYGDLLPITFISGLTLAQLTDIIIPGEDEESDDSLRKRYFDDLESDAYGGNKADYKQKTKELAGVGGVKVYPVWNGGGTVKLVIIDSTFNKPSVELVDSVQTEMDPLVNQGKGLGIAPIGHTVTVEAVSDLVVNITFSLTLAAGFTWVDVESYIRDAINAYFLEIKNTWEDESNLVVRIAQIESAILKVVGVVDITGTTLNGGLINLILTDVQIPVLGTVTNI